MSIPEKFLQKVRAALEGECFVKLTLSQARDRQSGLRNLYVRPVQLREGLQLSLLYRYATRDETKNHSFPEALEILASLIGSQFRSGHLFTTQGDWQLRTDNSGSGKLKASRPAFLMAPSPEHDRQKHQSLPPQSAFLQELGITNATGQPRPGMADKLRQIQRFVEILGHQLAESSLRDAPTLRVLDMGSGKGSLTFATYEFLQARGIRPEITGVELRPELVELTNQTAQRVGFEGLRFVPGKIGEYPATASTDVLIALHACDTATDDALFQAIQLGATLIITAPCCHKEVRPQIQTPPLMADVLKHGILLERQAEILTDSIRALLLEIHGYKATVFEFISPEHTGKNLMIAAIKRTHPIPVEPLKQRLHELMEFFGVRHQHLAGLLGISSL